MEWCDLQTEFFSASFCSIVGISWINSLRWRRKSVINILFDVNIEIHTFCFTFYASSSKLRHYSGSQPVERTINIWYVSPFYRYRMYCNICSLRCFVKVYKEVHQIENNNLNLYAEKMFEFPALKFSNYDTWQWKLRGTKSFGLTISIWLMVSEKCKVKSWIKRISSNKQTTIEINNHQMIFLLESILSMIFNPKKTTLYTRV